ncbi:MAG: hypothetical protein ACPGYX_03830 [Oceanobacter sp.]
MTNEQVSVKTLWQATAAAVLVGVIALVTLIMPAEYNIDPTGIGNALGLTALSPEKLAEANLVVPEQLVNTDQQSVELALAPGMGLEYKMRMEKGDALGFDWKTDGLAVYVDMHGEPEGDTTGYFLSYTETEVDHMKGAFTAAFTGSHGWYFKNNQSQVVRIQLFFNGRFENPHIR